MTLEDVGTNSSVSVWLSFFFLAVGAFVGFAYAISGLQLEQTQAPSYELEDVAPTEDVHRGGGANQNATSGAQSFCVEFTMRVAAPSSAK